MSIRGITREAEEQYLNETIAVVQHNLEHLEGEIKKLTEDTEHLMAEANKTRDKAILNLWNNARAQLNFSKEWFVRAQKARKKPYFGRIDVQDMTWKEEKSYYIGRTGIAETPTDPVVIDWRASIASLYYDNKIGTGSLETDAGERIEIDLMRKRTYEIEQDKLIDFYDLETISNDDLLTKYLSKNKSDVLGEIVATIQKEQNRIIRRSPKTNVIVQGVAGSGKTTVAMHRISYILFNYAEEFRPEDFYIIGSNQILLNYITGVLPDLDVYGIRQMTMEELFVRLLYEDWDAEKYSYTTLDQTDAGVCQKGTGKWFSDLQEFCNDYERLQIQDEDILLEHTGQILLSGDRIRAYIGENPTVSMQSKRLMLNEILYAQYENKMTGRYQNITEEEQKELDKKYHTYFAKWGKYGKSDWNGSIFELYRDFLVSQKEKGRNVQIPDTCFDVYDLAALAYLYKRIKETDFVREASHAVIDEAQDFGMMAYHCLHFCLRGCTYTIMGDTSQNIHYGYGLNDWSELSELILTGKNDTFGLLRKSYRNTVEISDFAAEILRHGDFTIYPIEPIIRHGKQVELIPCEDAEKMAAQAGDTITFWQRQGYETIAVICRNEEEAEWVTEALQGRFRNASACLQRDTCQEAASSESNLCDPPEALAQTEVGMLLRQNCKNVPLGEVGVQTAELKIRDMKSGGAAYGNGVMIFPVALTKGLEFDAVLVWNPSREAYPTDNGHAKLLYVAATRALHELTVLHTGSLTGLIADEIPEEKQQNEFVMKEEQEEAAVSRVTQAERLMQQKEYAEYEHQQRGYLGPKRIQVMPVQEKETEKTQGMPRQISTAEIRRDVKTDVRKKHFMKTETAEKGQDMRPVNESVFQYGEMPGDQALLVKGHVKADIAVKWTKKSRTSLNAASRYGTLSLTPVSEECIRIRFVKGMNPPEENSYWKVKSKAGVKWTAKESPAVIELATENVIIRIEKKDGTLKFMTPDRKMLLMEKSTDSRVIEGTECWNFLEFERSEKIRSKGTLKDDFTDVTNKARYISYGGRRLRMPLLLSSKGYALAIASEKTAMFCGMRKCGPYIYTEGDGHIDYFFLYGKSNEKNVQLYEALY